MPVPLTERDVAAVVERAQGLPSASGVYLEDDFVTNLLATVVDFQMHTTAVVRAIDHYKRTCVADLRTLEDLETLFAVFPNDRDGNTELAQRLWGYKLWTRAEMLRALCLYFRSIGVCDQAALRQWAETSTFKHDFEGRVKGLGPAVYNWLVMRQGVETVKPDVHVRRFAEGAVGRRLSDEQVVEVVSTAARMLDLKAYELDWRIWEAGRAADHMTDEV